MSPRVKICGITRIEDLRALSDIGQAINASLDINALLRTIYAEIDLPAAGVIDPGTTLKIDTALRQLQR